MSMFNEDEVRVQVAIDLKEVARLYGRLRVEAINRAGDPDMPGGAAMVMLGPGADVEAFGYMQLSAIFGRIDDEAVEEVLKSDIETPLAFLASWTDIVRKERGQEPSQARATIEGEVKYLAGATDWMLSTNEFGEPWFLAVEDFASGLSKVRYALETVLREGERPTRINAECHRCDAHPRLIVVFGEAKDGTEDGWACPKCDRPFSEAQVRDAWRNMLVRRGSPPVWVSVKTAAFAVGRPFKTIHRWTEPRANGTSKVEKRTAKSGGVEVLLSDVRAAHETAARKPWQSAS